MTRFGSKDYALVAAVGFIIGVLGALLWRELKLWPLVCILMPLYFVPWTIARAAAIGCCIGQCWVWVNAHWFTELQVPDECLRTPLTVEAKVSDFVRLSPGFNDATVQSADLVLLSVSTPSCALLKRIRVYYTGPRNLSLGDVISGQVVLRPERGFANFSSDDRKAKAVALQRLASGRLRTIYGQRRATHGVDFWRNSLVTSIQSQTHLSVAAKGVIAALVVADKRFIPEPYKALSLGLGIGHLLVISGLHIALVAGLISVIMRVLLRPLCWFTPWWARGCTGDIVVLAVAFTYAQLAGFSLPTQRALFALIFWVVAGWLGRDGQPLRLFLWALVLCLVANPFVGLLPAFWLSFGAVFIVLFASIALTRLKGFTAYLATHVVICMAMWPASLVFFGQASVLSVPANIVAVPVASFWLVPLSLLGSAAQILAWEDWAKLLWSLGAVPVDAIEQWLNSNAFTYGTWKSNLPKGIGLFITASALLVLTPLRASYRAALVLLMVLLSVYRPLALDRNSARLWVFDVGQGSSMLLQIAGRSLLFDVAGGLPGAVYHFDSTAAPILQNIGLNQVDTIVLSHEDFDHMGGFYSPNFDLHWRRLVNPKGQGSRAQPCRPGRVEHWSDDVTLQWLSGGANDASESDNDSSCVLKVAAYGVSVLFMADVGKSKERDLVSYWGDQLNADILIVGHHGSNTSSSATLLKWVKPRYAVISAGFDNPFGHPNTEVVKRLNAAGALILNTADTGALRFEWGDSQPVTWQATRAHWARFWQDNYSY